MARLAALQEAIVSLGVEEAPAVEAGQLELVVNVGGEHKVIFVAHEGEQVIIGGARRLHVPVAPDVAAPVRPVLLEGAKRVEASGVHVLKAVPLDEVAEDRLEARARVREARGRREAGARADDDRVRLVESARQALAPVAAKSPTRGGHQTSQVKHVAPPSPSVLPHRSARDGSWEERTLSCPGHRVVTGALPTGGTRRRGWPRGRALGTRRGGAPRRREPRRARPHARCSRGREGRSRARRP